MSDTGVHHFADTERGKSADMCAQTVRCGGCGNSDPDKRCIGCFHDFGDGGWPARADRALREACVALTDPEASRGDVYTKLIAWAKAERAGRLNG